MESGTVRSPAEIYEFDLIALQDGWNLPNSAHAGGLYAAEFGFPVHEVFNTVEEIAEWYENALKTAWELKEEYPREIADLLGLTASIIATIEALLPGSSVLIDLTTILTDALSDPLILDLDGDGLELISLTQSATQFDLDGDGALERTGWGGPQDGFLVHDVNGNGIVDGVAELFGSTNVDGFDELKTLDSNNDGKINASDAAFAQLRVWRDLNSDGQSTSDEMQTLAEAGIVSLGLGYTQVDQDIDGNIVARTGTYVRADGSSRGMGSVNFALEEILPAPTDSALLGDLLLLPNLSGQLGLTDLRTAMYNDPVLKAMVEDLTYGNHGFDTFAEFRDGGFLDVIYRWAGIDASVPLGPGDQPYHIQAMEAFMGRPFDALTERQLARVEDAWEAFVQQLGVQFLIQAADLPLIRPFLEMSDELAALNPDDPGFTDALNAVLQNALTAAGQAGPAYNYLGMFSGLSIDLATGAITGDFDEIVSQFLAAQPSFLTFSGGGGGSGGSSGSGVMTMSGAGNPELVHPWTAWYEDQGSLLFQIGQLMGFGSDYVLNVTGWRWLAGVITSHEGTAGDDLLDFNVTYYLPPLAGAPTDPIPTYDQLIFGFEGNDELRGNQGVDRLVGGPGNDLLKGGTGSDMYVYASGDGLDRISDDSGTDETIFFSSELDSANLQVTRLTGTNDLLVHFGDPSQGIILTNQWLSPGWAVEHFNFVGEPALHAGDIASRYLATLATAGADTIAGSWASERLIGLDGNDNLSGLDGNDILDGGNGNDTLNGSYGNDILLGGAGDDKRTTPWRRDGNVETKERPAGAAFGASAVRLVEGAAGRPTQAREAGCAGRPAGIVTRSRTSRRQWCIRRLDSRTAGGLTRTMRWKWRPFAHGFAMKEKTSSP